VPLQNPPQGPKFAADGLKHLADQIGDALRREKQQQLAQALSSPSNAKAGRTSWPPHGRSSRPRAQVMLDEILGLERGFVDNPYDPGGPTNFGVTKKTLGDWHELNSYPIRNSTNGDREPGRLPNLPGIPQNVEDLTVEQARALHQDIAYDQYRLQRIKDYDVAHHIFDMLINTSPMRVRDFVYGAIDDVMRRRNLYDGDHAPLTDLPEAGVGPQAAARIDWLIDSGYRVDLQNALVDRRRAYAESQPDYDKFPGLLPRIERFRPPNHPPEGWYE
jgi:hypothetical protein